MLDNSRRVYQIPSRRLSQQKTRKPAERGLIPSDVLYQSVVVRREGRGGGRGSERKSVRKCEKRKKVV